VYDVFISYARNDDVPPTDLPIGWVTRFVEELENLLRTKAGVANISVWRDNSLGSNEQVTPTLLEKVQSSRTLVLFMSPSYQHSSWCQGELGTFLEANPVQHNRESVFIVEIDPVSRENWHARLRELTQIRLWERQVGEKATRRLGYPKPKLDEDSPYWNGINELAHLIKTHLERLEPDRFALRPAVGVPLEPSPTPPPSPQPTVWVAEPTSDLADRWDDLVRSIRQSGCDIRPAGADSYDRSSRVAFLESVERDLESSALFVQLLSGAEGDASERAYTLIQGSAAREQAQRTGTAFLRWRPAGARLDGLENEAYQELLTGAIASGFEEFRQRVVSTIRGLGAKAAEAALPRSPLSPTGAEQPLAICVSAQPVDNDLRKQIVEMLQQFGEEPFAAPDPGPQKTSPDYNAQLDLVIEGSAGFIIVYGKCQPLWPLAQYLRARNILSQRRRGIWGALADGPPREKPPHGVPSRSVMTLDCTEGIKRDQIARFVDSLRGA
jgi:hypothetical protein